MWKMTLFVLFVAIPSVSLGIGGNLGNGSGTSENPYLIEDLDDFIAFCGQSLYWSTGKYTRLDCDPNLSVNGTYSRAPIASDTSGDEGFQGIQYNGHFDGNNHVIRNLTIDGELSEYGEYYDYMGLFGYVGENAEIFHLGIEAVSISDTYRYVGGLCGVNAGWVEDCYSTGSVEAVNYAGGVCGVNSGTIVDCSSSGSVKGNECLGGLCGHNLEGIVSRSHADGSVIGQSETGGLLGMCEGGTIMNCHSVTQVDGAAYVGGLCGRADGTFIARCYSSGSVVGYLGVGGFVGWNINDSFVGANYSNTDVEGSTHVGGLCGMNGAELANNFSAGTVKGTANVGGICGHNPGSIFDCYSTCTVEGDSSVGGLCGYNLDRIYHSYSIGPVQGQTDTGPFVGKVLYDEDDTEAGVFGCFWDVEVSGMGTAGDNNHDAIGKTTVQMYTRKTYTDAGWYFSSTSDSNFWHMPWEGQDYPRFGWQIVTADFVAPLGVDLADFAYFASYWGMTDCYDGDCAKADIIKNAQVGIEDLMAFSEEWLSGVY